MDHRRAVQPQAAAADPAALSLDDIKILEQARQRIYQLTTSIQRLQQEVYHQNPLPSWSSFQTNASILAHNVQNLAEHLDKHSQLLNRIAVHPSPNYPGRTAEDLLGVLLRKKLEPQVQTWVEEGREIAKGDAAVTADDTELWAFATGFMNERVAKYATEEANEVYTAAERELGVENVKTGLCRKLEEDESSDEDDDEDEEMEDVGSTVSKPAAQPSTQPGNTDDKSHEDARSKQDLLRMATSGSPPLPRVAKGKR